MSLEARTTAVGTATLLRLAAAGAEGWAIGVAPPGAIAAALARLPEGDGVTQARRLALALPEADATIPPAEALLAIAALDLAARAAGVPAAVLLGAAAPRGAAPVEPMPDPLPPGWVRLPEGPAALRDSLMAPRTLLILADPVAAGGPGGLRRLAAAARAFQVELALAPVVAHPLALAAAAQLRAGLAWPLSRPLLAAGEGWDADPAGPGFGWRPSP